MLPEMNDLHNLYNCVNILSGIVYFFSEFWMLYWMCFVLNDDVWKKHCTVRIIGSAVGKNFCDKEWLLIVVNKESPEFV